MNAVPEVRAAHVKDEFKIKANKRQSNARKTLDAALTSISFIINRRKKTYMVIFIEQGHNNAVTFLVPSLTFQNFKGCPVF